MGHPTKYRRIAADDAADVFNKNKHRGFDTWSADMAGFVSYFGGLNDLHSQEVILYEEEAVAIANWLYNADIKLPTRRKDDFYEGENHL